MELVSLYINFHVTNSAPLRTSGLKHTIFRTLDTSCWRRVPVFRCWVFFTGFHSLSLDMLRCMWWRLLCASCADLMHFTPSGSPAVFCRGMCKLNLFTSTVSTTVGAMFEVRNDCMGGKSGPDEATGNILPLHYQYYHSTLKVDSDLCDCV